jgi:hypothetical protein
VPANELKNIDQASPTTRKARKPRISPKIVEVVRLLLSGECKTQRAAAKRVDLAESYLSEALRRPHVRNYIESRVRTHLAAGTLAASRRMLELIDGPSSPVAFDAAKFTLGVAGIKPAADAQVSVNIEVKAGYVIDLSERDPAPKTIEHAAAVPRSEEATANERADDE